jgi:hypothetical protein
MEGDRRLLEASVAAGHHCLFVNIKTATSSMQQLHLLLLGCVVDVGAP